MMNSLSKCSTFMRLAGIVALLALAMPSLPPVRAAEIPPDSEQDVLVRSTLMTFNDANMTNNYVVFFAKASKELRTQVNVPKMQVTFEPFRKNELFFEDVVAAAYDSRAPATFDGEGALVLAGAFKTARMDVKYRLRFIQNDNVWKLLGLNVDAAKKKP